MRVDATFGPPRSVRADEEPLPPLSSCVIAAPCFTVRSRGISGLVARGPTGALCSCMRRGRLSAGGSAGWASPWNTAVQHCKRHRLCLRRKSLTVCKCFSSLSSYFYSATKHVSEVCRSFEYKGFSVVPLNPLAMSSAFGWLCTLQWISLGLFEASRHVVMITR